MVKEIPVIWLQTSACSGCTISLLNSASPTIKNILIDQIVPGLHINLRFHATIMAGAGKPAIEVLEDTAEEQRGNYVLVVEGAIPTATNAVYGAIGERQGKPVRMDDREERKRRSNLIVPQFMQDTMVRRLKRV